MNKTVLLCMLLVFMTGIVWCLSGADAPAGRELEQARDGIVSGKGFSAAPGVRIMKKHDSYGLLFELPLTRLIRIFAGAEALFDTEYSGILINTGLTIGAPPSADILRTYGGPLISVNIEYPYGWYLAAGGKGGVEFFSSRSLATFIEFGGRHVVSGQNYTAGISVSGS